MPAKEKYVDVNEQADDTANDHHYDAPKPKVRKRTWAKRIAFRFFFPPILLWDASKLLVNTLAGNKVGEQVLPAQNLGVADQEAFETKIAGINHSADLTADKYTVVTHDGAKLDTLQINHKNNDAVLPNQKQFIINFVGNGMQYEDIIDEMENDARELDCHVIGFNLRGVSNSKGKPKSKNDLVTDGIAQVQRLLDDGADPENITLKGHSLGAGVATLVAAHFHDHHQKVNLFNGRSFSTVTNFVIGQIRTADTNDRHNGHQETPGKKIIGWLAKPFVKFAMALTKWEIDAARAYKKLPESHKEYMVVRSSKRNRIRDGHLLKDDPVIPHYASLHTSLKSERTKQKTEIEDTIIALHATSTHALINQEIKAAQKKLIEARKHLRQRKMVADFKGDNAHVISMDELRDRYKKKTANDYFRAFFKRAHEHHEMEKAAANRVNQSSLHL